MIKSHKGALRVAFYSHDTQGLGHIRRNLAIAAAFAQMADPPTSLLVSGAPVAGGFTPPPGADLLVLPAVGKDGSGSYRARRLDLSLDRIIRLRAQTIRAALSDFAPDVFIVDKTPAGLHDELRPTLSALRRQGARLVLGLRDILDEPETTRREWIAAGNTHVIREFYHTVWVYGDPRVYNPVKEYGLPEAVASKVRFTGYLDRAQFPTPQSGFDPALLPPPGVRLALCMVGGGQDGERLAHSFAQAELPANTAGILITGPYMPQAAAARLADAARPGLQVMDFLPNPELLLPHADAVIAMGGYNTVSEILAHRKQALIVPRVAPRREQWLRARRLCSLGAVEMMEPGQVSPEGVGGWLANALDRPRAIEHNIDLNGLQRLPKMLADLASTRSIHAPRTVRPRLEPAPLLMQAAG